MEFDGYDNAADGVVAIGSHAEELKREVDLRVRGDRDGRPRQGCQRRVHFFFMGSPAGPGPGGRSSGTAVRNEEGGIRRERMQPL